MAEIKITTEVAGRVRAITSSADGDVVDSDDVVVDGDDIVLAEAMKMEIPVLPPPPEKSNRFSSASARSWRKHGPSRFSTYDPRKA